MIEILMVCTGNICRSPMAEGLLRHRLPAGLAHRVRVSSAGTYALHGNQPAPHAVTVMAAEGIDISGHRARAVNRELLRRVDLSLVMERDHLSALNGLLLFNRPRAELLSSFAPEPTTPDIADPYGGRLAAYQTCLQTLRPCIEGLIAWLADAPDLVPAQK